MLKVFKAIGSRRVQRSPRWWWHSPRCRLLCGFSKPNLEPDCNSAASSSFRFATISSQVSLSFALQNMSETGNGVSWAPIDTRKASIADRGIAGLSLAAKSSPSPAAMVLPV